MVSFDYLMKETEFLAEAFGVAPGHIEANYDHICQSLGIRDMVDLPIYQESFDLFSGRLAGRDGMNFLPRGSRYEIHNGREMVLSVPNSHAGKDLERDTRRSLAGLAGKTTLDFKTALEGRRLKLIPQDRETKAFLDAWLVSSGLAEGIRSIHGILLPGDN